MEDLFKSLRNGGAENASANNRPYWTQQSTLGASLLGMASVLWGVEQIVQGSWSDDPRLSLPSQFIESVPALAQMFDTNTLRLMATEEYQEMKSFLVSNGYGEMELDDQGANALYVAALTQFVMGWSKPMFGDIVAASVEEAPPFLAMPMILDWKYAQAVACSSPLVGASQFIVLKMLKSSVSGQNFAVMISPAQEDVYTPLGLLTETQAIADSLSPGGGSQTLREMSEVLLPFVRLAIKSQPLGLKELMRGDYRIAQSMFAAEMQLDPRGYASKTATAVGGCRGGFETPAFIDRPVVSLLMIGNGEGSRNMVLESFQLGGNSLVGVDSDKATLFIQEFGLNRKALLDRVVQL